MIYNLKKFRYNINYILSMYEHIKSDKLNKKKKNLLRCKNYNYQGNIIIIICYRCITLYNIRYRINVWPWIRAEWNNGNSFVQKIIQICVF